MSNSDTLPITKYPSQILRIRASEIDSITADIKQLAQHMVPAMKANDGIGLAAPQVNISKRIIVVQDSEASHVFLNPRIVKKSKQQATEEEGCLSLPGIFVPVKRSEKIEVLCETLDRQVLHIKAEGLLARIFQHEIDHLNGFLIINRISPFRRLKLKHQLKELENKLSTS